MYAASVVLGVGPVRGSFDANVGLFDLDEPQSAVLRGDLSGALGAASGEGCLTLTPHQSGCRIDYRYDIHLTGRVAMIGGRMIDGAARLLIGEFFRRFAASLGGGGKVRPGLRGSGVLRRSLERGDETSRLRLCLLRNAR